MRLQPRTDANQQVIVRLLRQLGCHVLITASLGNGAPDLIVSRGMQTVFVEVKDGSKPPSARRLTDDEEAFRLECQGKARYVVVETEEDALALVNSLC